MLCDGALPAGAATLLCVQHRPLVQSSLAHSSGPFTRLVGSGRNRKLAVYRPQRVVFAGGAARTW